MPSPSRQLGRHLRETQELPISCAQENRPIPVTRCPLSNAIESLIDLQHGRLVAALG